MVITYGYNGRNTMRKELLDAIQQGNTRRFYKSREWKRKRKDIIRRDDNECQKCKREGGAGRAETVHHMKHLKDFPELALVDSNLISLCYQCHNEEHPEKLQTQATKKKIIIEERWE